VTGEEALAFAASYGVRVTLVLGDLHLNADRELPVEALDVLRDHREAVVAELGRIEAADQLRRTFEAHVANVMRLRPRLEAERVAFDNLLTERLNSTHPDTDPNRCAHCGRPETPSAVLLPIGAGVRHAWLHERCWESWRERRRAEAIVELAEAGVVKPEESRPNDYGLQTCIAR
jgi:hypothetical protein